MKNALRKQMREKRQALSPALHAKKSMNIRQRLEEEAAFEQAQSVLVYLSTPEEVDTHGIVKDLLTKGITVYAPRVTKDELILCKIDSWEALEPSTMGILEARSDVPEAHPQNVDLILVPGIAFDEHGHRIGYGKGYYDKLLKTIRGYKVGLAFSEQVINEIPSEAHDVPLDLIITDSSSITLNPFTP